MTDLHDRLARLAGASGETSAAQADADVDRGRRALRRRHTTQRMGAVGFATAVLAVAVAYGTTTTGGPTPGTSPSVVTAKLVAYQGEQPKGFTIDKVPSGWEIQGVSPGALTVAPVGIADQEPDSFVGKIAVMLQSQDDKSTPTGTPVTVGGKPGVINEGLGTDHGKNLWVKQPNGIWLEVQIWDATGWTPESMVEFADGIHVLPTAVQGRG